MDLDRRYGPLPGRVWGLVLNLIGNVVAMYGLAGYLRNGSGLLWLGLGVAVTLSCILALALPQRR